MVEVTSYISGVMDWSCDLDEEFIKSSTYADGSSDISVLRYYSHSELKFKVVAEKYPLILILFFTIKNKI